MNHKYVSIDRVFSKLGRDVTDSFNEGDIIEWAGEALEFIGTVKMYEEAVAFVDVKNFTCALPPLTHAIIQVARNNRYTPSTKNLFCPRAIKEVIETTSTTPDIPVQINCIGEPINDYDLAYYRPYFDLKFEYEGWTNSSLYRGCFSPVRLKTHSFFETVVCKEQDQRIYNSCRDEYTVAAKGTTLRFSFEEGQVAIALLRQQVDEETGYPLIPDNVSHTSAIVNYVTYMMFKREFYNGREGAERKMAKAEQDWTWYCSQAGNKDMAPFGVDEHQNLLDQRSYMLPRQNRYYGFFGNLAVPESRKWNNRFNNTYPSIS